MPGITGRGLIESTTCGENMTMVVGVAEMIVLDTHALIAGRCLGDKRR